MVLCIFLIRDHPENAHNFKLNTGIAALGIVYCFDFISHFQAVLSRYVLVDDNFVLILLCQVPPVCQRQLIHKKWEEYWELMEPKLRNWLPTPPTVPSP